MHPRQLLRAFFVLVPASLLLLQGCSGSTFETSEQVQSLDETVCATALEGAFGFASDAKLPAGIDFVGAYSFDGSPGGGVKYDAEALHLGTACSGAKDAATCRASLASPSQIGGWRRPCRGMCGPDMLQVRLTRGDAVEFKMKSALDVSDLFLPIDSAKEAAVRMLATGNLGSLDCSVKNAHREKDGSFLLRTTDWSCKAGQADKHTQVDRIVRVTPEGVVSEVVHSETEVDGICPEAFS